MIGFLTFTNSNDCINFLEECPGCIPGKKKSFGIQTNIVLFFGVSPNIEQEPNISYTYCSI